MSMRIRLAPDVASAVHLVRSPATRAPTVLLTDEQALTGVGHRRSDGLITIRPCDANEAVEAWRVTMRLHHSPVALVLTRQAVPIPVVKQWNDGAAERAKQRFAVPKIVQLR